jgi:hypothetical protein
MFWKLSPCLSSGEGRETSTVLCILKRAYPIPVNEVKSSFQNIMFYSYLEFWMMDKVHEPNEFELFDLPKRWKTLNSWCNLALETEATHWAPTAKTEDYNLDRVFKSLLILSTIMHMLLVCYKHKHTSS